MIVVYDDDRPTTTPRIFCVTGCTSTTVVLALGVCHHGYATSLGLAKLVVAVDKFERLVRRHRAEQESWALARMSNEPLPVHDVHAEQPRMLPRSRGRTCGGSSYYRTRIS
jgi:hypothetical protein